MTNQANLLSIHEIAEILDGHWVVEPTDDHDLIEHYAIYSGELLHKEKANLWFAMDLPTWQRGTKNTGVYATTFPDSHAKVSQFQNLLKMAIVQHPVAADVPQLQVEDPYAAMVKLFKIVNQRAISKNIGITGTVGKSTMKELVSALLSMKTTTRETPANHNSRTSSKVSILNNSGAEYNVLEIAVASLWYGKQHVGVVEDIKLDFAILTQVGVGQKGYDEHQMADFKTRLAYGLKPGRPFLINGEIANIDEVLTDAQRYTTDLVTYGLTDQCDFVGKIDSNSLLTVTYQNRIVAKLAVAGFDEGLISNIIGALATYHLLVGALDDTTLTAFSAICQAMAKKVSQKVRVNQHELTIVDDTHNAELLSMTNFMDYAQNYPVAPGTKKIFIAGRIINLEKQASQVYGQLVTKFNQSQFDQVYTFGPEIDQVATEFAPHLFAGQFTNMDALIKSLITHLTADTVVFIKGSSRNSNIRRIGRRLVSHADYFANHDDEVAISEIAPSKTAYTLNGVGRLLVVLECLERLTYRKINLTDLVKITQDLAKDRSVNKIGLTIGESQTLLTLLSLAIVAPAPDVIINLAEHLFGGNRAAALGLRKKAQQLGLSDQALVNITGRPTRFAQRTYLSDLEKIGSAYIKLPNEFLSLLSLQRAQPMNSLKSYQKRSQLLKTGKVYGSIFFGPSETNGLIFFNNQTGRHFIAFINAPHISYIDAKIETLIDGGLAATTATAPLKTIKLEQPVVNLLSDTYFGEMYTRARQRRQIDDALQKYGYGYSFEKLGPFFTESAYNIFNFEAVFSEGPSALTGIKPFVLDAKVEPTIQELKKRHFNLAMLGNNHAKDAGATALINTVTAFHQADISTIGAGIDQADSRRLIEFEYDGQKTALFNGYWYRNPAYNLFDFYAKTTSAGVNCLDTLVWEDVRAYRRQHPQAKIIVSAHWGNDFHESILPAQQATAERLVNAGADLIIGHGPHILQPLKFIGHAPVVYSIGNGVFNNNGEFVKRGCLAYGATVRLNLAKGELYLCPFYANNRETFWQPDFVNDEDFKEAANVFGRQYATTKLAGLNAVKLSF
ncbi:CapA family protein [Lactiplantibacillus sp. WILCCON 0030]|uniref:CapA family protein n=1 Tax=Lactiplantibacillus brownii TaxID=3069269 RepID=A0ABU1A617_9LACO|nr:CapA family protein [Lactiplantibacillus brownii]MDQ7936368.1 CapA family protein [Lactiplantibacillus brownii]